jgi:uncharacterized protein YbaR (Trm112 family)
MHISTLDILRCPFCGGRFDVVTSMFLRREDDEIHDAILGCHCCIFPVVAGIPVLHLQPAAVAARGHVEEGRPDRALAVLVGLEDEAQAARFAGMAASRQATFKDLVEALGPTFEGGYFLYRYSDPTYRVAHAVVRAVAGVVLHGARRAIDVCAGTGPLTRALVGLSSPPPVMADLFFAKLWLARRFTLPGAEAVCCDGNGPLPFARGAFGFAMCSDAFQFIWTKRQFIGEMSRLVDGGGEPGAVLISHTHNQLTWSPSHGQPLSPAGYQDLFETIEPRVFGEAGLFADLLRDGRIDLSRRDEAGTLDADPALTIVATAHTGVFVPHVVESPGSPLGEFRINPLYDVREDGDRLHLTLRFPSADYEDEFGACREYLPEETTIDRAAFNALRAGERPAALEDFLARRVIVDLPGGYY